MRKRAELLEITVFVKTDSSVIFFKDIQLNEVIVEYYGAAEPPVRCGESHLSGLTEPLRSL